MGSKDFAVYINRDHYFQLTLKQGTGAFNLTGASEITLATKENVDANTTGFTVTKTGGGLAYVTDGEDGLVILNVACANTSGLKSGKNKYGVRVDIGTEKFTPLMGNVEFMKTFPG